MVPFCAGEGAGEEDDLEVVGEVPQGGISSTVLVAVLLLAVWDDF